MTLDAKLAEIEKIKATCWKMAGVFLDLHDAHGLHDMGVELQALERAEKELRTIEIG